MIILDTHAIVFDALAPDSLSTPARKAIDSGFRKRELTCADISLWEIAMLVAHGRLDPGMDARQFIDDAIGARHLTVLPITAEIAVLAQSDAFVHRDPADRLIAATAQLHGADLVTSDRKLRQLKHISTIW